MRAPVESCGRVAMMRPHSAGGRLRHQPARGWGVTRPAQAIKPQGVSGALVIEDLACRRGQRLLFEGVRARVEPGGALLLVGPNGAGKSSLLRLLAG
ncbi:ABC transporter ATP-binding protein, partial [Sandarakinorhabdus rubra]|uniref:ABC transporter ATP-binding protein n=1 Tax=Sandarakinorhabdus rubra TaxID=2672568 RepID=UPI002E2C1EC4